jgi:fumarylacetoacetase
LAGGVVSNNFYYAPSVYNGRTSSIVPSPEPVRRPHGIIYDPATKEPTFCPSKKMDFELEMGIFVSKPVPIGERISIEDAANHIFGFVLLNDWSARDLQAFEMNPLGPFHSKGESYKTPKLLTNC